MAGKSFSEVVSLTQDRITGCIIGTMVGVLLIISLILRDNLDSKWHSEWYMIAPGVVAAILLSIRFCGQWKVFKSLERGRNSIMDSKNLFVSAKERFSIAFIASLVGGAVLGLGIAVGPESTVLYFLLTCFCIIGVGFGFGFKSDPKLS